MARTPLTPVAAQSNARQHATNARDAASLVLDILSGRSDGDIEGAAKTLEAAGCYIRRQQAKGLLTS